MPLTMRPTGGHSPVYQDRQDWTILDEGQPVGRIYEDTSASTSADMRWFWAITVYVWPGHIERLLPKAIGKVDIRLQKALGRRAPDLLEKPAPLHNP